MMNLVTDPVTGIMYMYEDFEKIVEARKKKVLDELAQERRQKAIEEMNSKH